MNAVTEDYSKLSEEVKKHVRSFFHDITNHKLVYHNLVHTENVVAAATKIAHHYKLNERDSFVVITASWFHDIGYFTVIEHHEEKGAAIAESFLKEREVSEETIGAVKACILATHLPQKPSNLLEQIICDADLFHLGTDDFEERDDLVRKEAGALRGKKIKRKAWRIISIKLQENHHYFTEYCNTLLNEKKRENLEKLKRKQLEIKGSQNDNEKVQVVKKHELHKNEDSPEDELKAKDAPTSRGIQIIFRNASANNQRLSAMADNKAHIMITVNSIILSVILGLLLRKLEPGNPLEYPAVLFIIVSLATITFSVLATRPSISNGKFTPQELADKKVNLIFFGNFYKMSFEDYSAGMYKVMGDRNFLYETLIKDVYSQGTVLGRKYQLLRFSYNIFMYGLIASVLAFLVALLFFSQVPLQTVLKNTAQTEEVSNISPAGYDLTKPEKFPMPEVLNEISGIAFNKNVSDTIYAEEDENGKLFHFKLGDINPIVCKFGKHGDFEDVAISKGYVIMLRSDGVFFTFPLKEANQEVITDTKEWDDLLPAGEYESIAAPNDSGKLFVLCKHSKEKNHKISSSGYIFKLTDDGNIVSAGNFEVNVEEIEAHLDNKKIAFHLSGLAQNPCTKEWYIISSVNKLLVVTDNQWKVKDVFPLDPILFDQPEGIAFDKDCNLFISNEKNTAPEASILKFKYKAQ